MSYIRPTISTQSVSEMIPDRRKESDCEMSSAAMPTTNITSHLWGNKSLGGEVWQIKCMLLTLVHYIQHPKGIMSKMVIVSFLAPRLHFFLKFSVPMTVFKYIRRWFPFKIAVAYSFTRNHVESYRMCLYLCCVHVVYLCHLWGQNWV